MCWIRVASLAFLIALAFAPRPALAQGPGNLNGRVAALEATVTALDARLRKLEGNIGVADLAGTYAFYLMGVSIDPPGTVATFNTMSSYVAKGTMTLTATTPTGGTGTLNGVIDGVQLTEQAPTDIWAWAASPPEGLPQSSTLAWTFDSGTRTVRIEPATGLQDFDLSFAAGGQVLVSVKGGTPSNNQQMIVLIRN